MLFAPVLGFLRGQLEDDGVAAFAASYHNLLQSIAEKTARLSGTNG
mgnify:CR=1 FL=1